MERFERNSRNLIGMILIFIGLFLIGRNVGLFGNFVEDVIFSWQTLLILIGFIILLTHHNRTTGLILMSVGGFFLLPELFGFGYREFRLFWPALLIIVGLLIIFRKQIDHSKHFPRHGDRELSRDEVDIVSFFSGTERQITTPDFKGGKITSVFGGVELDFTDGDLAPGENVLDTVCVFGGVGLVVPDDWDVNVDVVSIFGGFSDKRKLRSGRVVDPSKQLTIKGIVVFGGGEMKSYK